jgi:Lrp/AsnC family transcriptional regulator for asnA, asnC and gidA
MSEPTLDNLDFEVLSCLQQDGRMSFTVMADKLHVSVGTIRTRVNKLIEDGTINIMEELIQIKLGFVLMLILQCMLDQQH